MGYKKPKNIQSVDEVEARRLLKEAKCGCEFSRDDLIMGFYERVENIASKYAKAHQHIDPDDLMADGFLAIGNCIEAFDLGNKRNFVAYVTVAIDNAIKTSDFLFDTMDIPDRFKSFFKYYFKVKQELIQTLHKEDPNDSEIALEMARQDDSDKPFDEKLYFYKGQIRDYHNNVYTHQRVYLDDPIDENNLESGTIGSTISIYDEDPYLLEVESDIEIKGIIATIKAGDQYPFESTRNIDYDKLMIEIGENFLDEDERLILYHSYGYLDHEKLPLKEINKKLAKPMTNANLIGKRKRIIKRIKNFFC